MTLTSLHRQSQNLIQFPKERPENNKFSEVLFIYLLLVMIGGAFTSASIIRVSIIG